MKEFKIVRGLFDNRKRSLIVSEDYIKFENSDLKSSLFTTINKDDLIGIRYGYDMIRGLEFYIGREYKIFLLQKNGQELKVSFKLFYGRKLQEKHQLHNDIVDAIWECFCTDWINDYYNKFENDIEFSIGKISVTKDGIEFDKKSISYEDLDLKLFKHYFMIQSKINPYNNKMLYYLKDSNSVILLSLLKYILKEKWTN